jgi:hypothetical protein
VIGHGPVSVGEHHPGDPEPAVDTVLEVGSVPNPEVGFSGDLLTFTRHPSGWVMQHNRAPHLTPVTFALVEWWAPLRIVARPAPWGDVVDIPTPRRPVEELMPA